MWESRTLESEMQVFSVQLRMKLRTANDACSIIVEYYIECNEYIDAELSVMTRIIGLQ